MLDKKSKRESGFVNSVEEAIADIQAGRIVIIVDDKDRENEGDFVASAELITPDTVNFMATYGRGLICASIPEERCEELSLDLMVGHNTALHETPFTISVDLIGQGCTTGISAMDRAKTIKALVDQSTRPEDLGRPGHVFPLKAKSRGVLRRAGHTEAAVDITRMAGLAPGGVLVEIMNEDGTMARLPDLIQIAQKWNLKIITIEDMISYRLKQESLIIQGEQVDMPTDYGTFKLVPFIQKSNQLEHVALIKGEWDKEEPILVRVHSSCVTGDIFGSRRCDCGTQLHKAMEMIDQAGKGVIVYLNQEGRGIGLFNKMKAYKLQENGRDTVDANLDLGFQADERDYGVGASILHALQVKHMKLITNNPVKRAGLQGYNLKVDSIVKIDVEPNQHNEFYLQTKKDRMGHWINFPLQSKSH